MNAREPLERAPAGAWAGTEPRVFTIPPGTPFLAALARALLDGTLAGTRGPPSPLALSAVTVLVPDSNAARGLEEALIAAAPDAALLLPRVRPIGEGEEELSLLAAHAGVASLVPEDADIPEAVSGLERRLALTRLVRDWARAMESRDGPDWSAAALNPSIVADTPAKALRIAADLSRLIDMREREGVALAGLDDHVPAEFREHWRTTRDLLDVATMAWPAYLAGRGLVSGVERRNRQMRAEARRLSAMPPAAPVVAAGFTRASPETIDLIRAVLGGPHGALVLPGLDLALDGESWDAVSRHPEHPQFGLKKLIDRLGVARGRVRVPPGVEATAKSAARARFVSEALRPAATARRWHEFAAGADRALVAEALAEVHLILAPSAQDEAETIALILREAAETPGRTAALVTPDRALARRVAARLRAFGVAIGMGGTPLGRTLHGGFLDLVIGAPAAGFAPQDLAALFKHPLCRLGFEAPAFRRAARTLEIAAFRAPWLGTGLGAAGEALDRAEEDIATGARRHGAARRLRPEDWRGARDLVARLTQAFEPLTALFGDGKDHPLGFLARAHAAAAGALAREHPGARPSRPFSEEGKPLLDALAGDARSGLTLAAAGYPEFYRALAREETARPSAGAHPRLFIWSPLESRLKQTDVMVLGGLNDGTWPAAADPGPWLDRPMRAGLGLPSPEERIGELAHGFALHLGAERVYLTRAMKVDGVPTVSSRWLLRMTALLETSRMRDAIRADAPWLAWARARDAIETPVPPRPPEPRPPLAARPRKLSVSAIETWMANPYAIFAGRILRLEPLDEIGLPPGAPQRGTVVHAALSRFAEAFPRDLPADPERELLAAAEDVLRIFRADPRAAAFWRPRFERFARWFAETEGARREGAPRVHAEIAGELTFAAPGGPFTLTARADRLDEGEDGLVLTDYKTGSNLASLAGRAAKGQAPQLPLEAAIAAAGGFPGVAARAIRGLRYISAAGGEPPGEERPVNCADAGALAADSLAGLARLVARFDQDSTPYRAARREGFDYRFDDYAHLARVAEWRGFDGEGD